MKHQVCIIMTSLLWVLGQCSSSESQSGIKVPCSHLDTNNILKVNCTPDYSGLAGKPKCTIENVFLTDQNGNNVDVPELKTLTFDIPDPKGNYTLDVQTDCGPQSQTIIITRGEHDQIFDEESRPPTADPPVQTGAVWAIGAVIVALIFGIVFLMLRRPSNLWMSRRRIPSADMDVERNQDSSSHQDSDCEPLSGGQEPRDSHTPPTTSHKDDVSS